MLYLDNGGWTSVWYLTIPKCFVWSWIKRWLRKYGFPILSFQRKRELPFMKSLFLTVYFIFTKMELCFTVWGKENCKNSTIFRILATFIYRVIYVSWMYMYVYNIIVKNKYSFRIEMTLSCAMVLQNYPLDKQVCPVTIESCEYV
jgi:hypothetical protein